MARIISCQAHGAVTETELTLDWLPRPPTAPASLWTGIEENCKVGDLHRLVRRRGTTLTFETHTGTALSLKLGTTYTFINWWSPHQLGIAHSAPDRWAKQRFTPKDAIEFRLENERIRRKLKAGEVAGSGTVVPGGWDHEHCVLCWTTISDIEEELQEGYTDDDKWLCEACYTTYVATGFGSRLGDSC